MGPDPRLSYTAICAVVSFSLSGCGSLYEVNVPRDIRDEYVTSYPVRSITGFTQGLACLGRMLRKAGVDPILVTSAPLPDFSESRGAAGFGAREMLISAISEVSRESGSVRYVAYDRATPDIIALQSAHPDKANFKVPDFFIRGAITQIEKTPFTTQRGSSVDADSVQKEIKRVGLAYSNSVRLSSISMELNMGMISTFQILPGISASNSLAVSSRGKAGEIALSVWKIGALYNINENESKALSTALRALIEVGVIELFGKLYSQPYWECLAQLGSNAKARAEGLDKFNKMNDRDRADFVARELRRQDYLKHGGDVYLEHGVYTDDFRLAIAKYQARYNLVGNTLISFPLFEKLYRQSKVSLSDLEPGSALGPSVDWLQETYSNAPDARIEAIAEEDPQAKAGKVSDTKAKKSTKSDEDKKAKETTGGKSGK